MKKIFALVLCMTMLLSTFVFVAEAESSCLIEDFESMALGNIGNAVSFRTSNEMFNDTFFYDSGATIEVVEDGYKGKGLKVTEDGGSPFQLGVLPVTPTEGNPVYFTFKMKILDDVNGTANMPIMLGYDNFIYIQQNSGRGVLWPMNDSDKELGAPRMPYQIDKWYTFNITFTTDCAYAEISDDDGNMTKGYNKNSKNKYFVFKSAPNNQQSVAGASIMIDEMYMYTIDRDEAVIIDSATLPEDISSMSRKPSFELGLNQPVNLDDAVVSVVDSDGKAVENLQYSLTSTGLFGIGVEIKSMLGKGIDYTLSISGLKDYFGDTEEDLCVEFTTEYAHMLEIVDKSVTVEDGEVSAEIIFDNPLGYDAVPVKVMCVAYENGMMTAMDYANEEIDEDGKLTLSFDMGELTGKEELGILVFDEANTLIPVSEAIGLK